MGGLDSAFSLNKLNGLWWLLLTLGPLVVFQRALHRELQAVLFLIFRRQEFALILFSILLFPGVLLHETSHFVIARLLRVRTGRFSLIPQPLPNGRLQLGFVETARVDFARDALIGAAPLLAGGLFVAFAGLVRLDLAAVWGSLALGDLTSAFRALADIYARPDFWLWFYLTVAVSSTMLPSASDRRAWTPVVLVLALLVGLALFLGAGPWMSANLLPWLDQALGAVAVVFAISAQVNLAVFLSAWILRKLLSKVTGIKIVGV
jgi:hypothetical protein